MRKSLFKKFYIIFVSVVLAGFLFLGSIVLAFSGKYWMNRNQQLLASQADTLSQQIESAARIYGGLQLNQYAYQISQLVGQAANSQVLVVDGSGLPVAIVGNIPHRMAVPSEFLLPYLQAPGSFVGTMDEVLQAPCLVAASPLVIEGRAHGVVYVMQPTGQAGEYMWDLLQLLLIGAFLTTVVMAVVAYFVASALVKPLQEMSYAAHRLANGDFSHQIEVCRQDEIGQLAASFNHMTASLKAGEQMRKGFVANVSHELKTPMTTIAGFVDGILDGTVPPAKQAEYLTVVSAEVKRLSRLVNTMLNLSKLESGEVRLNLQPANLQEMVWQGALLHEGRYLAKNIEVTGLEELPLLPVVVDLDFMNQVIQNLLDNTVKYTPEKGLVSIAGFCREGQVHLLIRNTGQGIDEAHLPFVFDRFYKVDQSRGDDRNSMGLGLYLVKTIVSLHNGRITVRSVKNSFCEFELVLQEHRVTESVAT